MAGTFTYDEAHPADLDWVRFLITETDITPIGSPPVQPSELSDEQIQAVIDEQTALGAAIKYYAAADCLSALVTGWMSAGKGREEEHVKHVKIKYGLGRGGDLALAIQNRVSQLRGLGRHYSPTSTPYILRVL